MKLFPNSEAISRIKKPLDWTSEKDQLMVKACREMALFHSKNSPELGALYRRKNFNPEMLETTSDLAKIPTIGVTAMKEYLLTSLPHEKAVLKLTSSGTRGQKTQIWFDEESLDRVQTMLWELWEQEGLTSERPTNYVNFIYDPNEAKDLGISFSVKNEQRFAPPAESYFAVKKDSKGQWEFRIEATIAKLREFSQISRPVRLLGIPSFMYEMILTLKSRDRIQLPKGSYLITGGGWKAAEDKSVSREEFRRLVGECLGIPGANIRDSYGMAEHSAPYIECKNHRFHIPVYNRILIRDPISLNVLPDGEVGLMELITPFNAMMPNLAILSTDLGYVSPIACECGQHSPTFTLIGRGGLVKHKGCAITASEIVRRDS